MMTWFQLVVQLALLFLYTDGKADDSTQRLLVVINTQDNAHHLNYAKLTQSYITQQAADVRERLIVEVIVSTETWPDLTSTWTFFPLINEVADLYKEDGINWLLIIPEYTEINLQALEVLIAAEDSGKERFIGRALQDKGRYITHHFADTTLKYPDTSSGMLLSWPLVLSIHSRPPQLDFNIDPRHELAKYIYDEGQGTELKNAPEFCTSKSDETSCATHYSMASTLCPSSSVHKPVTEDDMFVMIKTGEVFHKTRVPLQGKLWTNKVKNKEICSEKLDETIPTVKLDAPNTEQGHCAKFYAILKRANKMEHIKSKRWLVIVDDDTIMNITRLAKLLSCYSTDSPVAVGEKYGYQAHRHGYSYITGGGGTVLNMAAVKTVVNGGYKCNKDDSPDDMMLGLWLRGLSIPIIHSALFHQAPPSNYAPEYVELQKSYAISFHKYSPDDPEMVAREWLGLTLDVEEHTRQHNEL